MVGEDAVSGAFAPEDIRFDPLNTVTLVKDGDTITGNVHYKGDWYKIRPLRSGGHALVAVDQKAMPPDHPPAYANLPVRPMPVRPATKANTVIRVMVNYTPAAAAAAGNISSLIDLAVAESQPGLHQQRRHHHRANSPTSRRSPTPRAAASAPISAATARPRTATWTASTPPATR